jgi:RNA polymerase sigma-70 factor (ECF subfamily)
VSVAEPAATGLETAAAERLYERNASRVFGYCLKMLGSREEAEDASQTTFMQAFRALKRGVVPTYETAWLLTIAKNVCFARHRASGRRKAVELVRDPQDIEGVARSPEHDDGSLVGLQDALARLPEMQRRAFLMREWQGRSYAEIALELGVTVPAVEALIFRARRSLAVQLGGEERRRRHAFDIASLVASLKTLLGGGAAVKVAVGAAAAVSVGALATGSVERREAPAPVRSPVAERPWAPVERVAPSRNAAHVAAIPSKSRPDAQPAGGATAQPARRDADEPTMPGAPSGPGAPAASSPQPAPRTPAPPQQGQPATPALPTTPPVPEPPTLPQVELPEIPGVPLPEVPEVPLPQVELPPLPTDQLPVDVPDLPVVPDLPILP